MKLRKGLVSLIGLVGGVFGLGGAAAHASVATPATMPFDKDYYSSETWSRVREGLQRGQTAPVLSPEIIDLIESAELDRNLLETVRLSYKLVPAGEIDALDEFWLETMLQRGDPREIAHYLSIRASLDLSSLPRADALVDRWVWQVQYGGGSGGGRGPQGNNGFGNGDQDAPGNSGPNNNAENALGNNGNGNGGGNRPG